MKQIHGCGHTSVASDLLFTQTAQLTQTYRKHCISLKRQGINLLCNNALWWQTAVSQSMHIEIELQ